MSGWTGLEYLRQWSDLARSFDIATGFFEIGALLALDGKWQQLEKIRLLMGDEVSLQTHKVFKEALRQRVGRLDDSLEHEKGPNPFLEGVEAVVEAIAEGRIECRVCPCSSVNLGGTASPIIVRTKVVPQRLSATPHSK